MGRHGSPTLPPAPVGSAADRASGRRRRRSRRRRRPRSASRPGRPWPRARRPLGDPGRPAAGVERADRVPLAGARGSSPPRSRRRRPTTRRRARHPARSPGRRPRDRAGAAAEPARRGARRDRDRPPGCARRAHPPGSSGGPSTSVPRRRPVRPGLERDVEAVERLARPAEPSVGPGEPGEIARPAPSRRTSTSPRRSSMWPRSRASDRTSSWLCRTTSTSGAGDPPRRKSRYRPGISQPSTSGPRSSPRSSASTVRRRASVIRWRKTRRTNGSRSRCPAWTGGVRRVIR